MMSISLVRPPCAFGDRSKGMLRCVSHETRDRCEPDRGRRASQEAQLLAEGSRQEDLWGINLYPDLAETDWFEFDSMINLRPSFGNRSRGVDDPALRERIAALVRDLVIR